MPEAQVTKKGADRLRAGHPWVFSSDVADRGDATPGSVVKVLDHRRRPLGVAHYSSTSQITLRFLSSQVEPVDRAFFLRRLCAAADHRQRVVRDSDSYRLVHAEGDFLPALIVDRYGDYLTIQTLNQGMDAAKDTLLDCLKELFTPAGIVARNDVAVRAKEGLPLSSSVLVGDVPPRVVIQMNGLTLQVDLLGGQKTGVYLDQRENYLAAARYATGEALDCFSSTGGFALHLAGKCQHVEGVDSSAAALETARANAHLNHFSNVEFREADAFDLLAGYAAAGRRFSMVVLDPPAFAKSRGNLESAARGYKEINLRALRLLSSGGVLVSCSCSHHISEAMLLEIIAEASLDAGRRLRVLERRTQAQDHPILLTVPETHYLKCLIFEVV